MVWTALTLVNQLEFAALFVLCFLVGAQADQSCVICSRYVRRDSTIGPQSEPDAY